MIAKPTTAAQALQNAVQASEEATLQASRMRGNQPTGWANVAQAWARVGRN